MMKRTLIGAAIATLVAVPAVIGLWGNSSFSQEVPVRVPASGQVLTPPSSPSPSPSPSASLVDDNGGDVPRDERTEPGDDRALNGQSQTTAPTGSTDDHRGGANDDESGHDAGDDHGGHGSDD